MSAKAFLGNNILLLGLCEIENVSTSLYDSGYKQRSWINALVWQDIKESDMIGYIIKLKETII